jgi:hypothetical protein
MATQTLAAADAALKDLYVGPIIEQLNNKTFMLDMIERDSDSIDHTGRRAIIPLHVGRNRGRGSRAGSPSNLPEAGRQQYADAIVYIRYHYHGMEIDDPAIEASKSNEGAFINLLNGETRGLARDMRKDINRQVYGTGDGVLATVRANSTSTTLLVDDVQYIHPGDVVDVLVTATGASTAGVVGATVLSKTNTAGSEEIELDTALAGTAGTTYSVYVHGSRNNEMDGLRNIINTNRTLHGIDSSSASNSYWNAIRRDAGGAVAGEGLFEDIIDAVGEAGEDEVTNFVTTRGIRRRLADTFQSQKRFNDAQAVTIHGGYTAIMVNEVPVVKDDDCPKGYAFGFNRRAFKWFEQTKPGWLEQENSSIFQLKNAIQGASDFVGKQNVWQAWFRWYSALGCVEPNQTGAIVNADDDVPTGTA